MLARTAQALLALQFAFALGACTDRDSFEFSESFAEDSVNAPLIESRDDLDPATTADLAGIRVRLADRDARWVLCQWTLGESLDAMRPWGQEGAAWLAHGFDTPDPEDDRRGIDADEQYTPGSRSLTPSWLGSVDGEAFLVAGVALTTGAEPELVALSRVGYDRGNMGGGDRSPLPDAVAEALRGAREFQSFGWTAEDGPSKDEWVRRWTGRIAGGTVHDGPVEFRESAGLYVGLEVRSVPVTE